MIPAAAMTHSNPTAGTRKRGGHGNLFQLRNPEVQEAPGDHHGCETGNVVASHLTVSRRLAFAPEKGSVGISNT